LGTSSAVAKPAPSGAERIPSKQSALLTASSNWGDGVEAVLPANAAEVNGGAFIESVSCPSAGNCSAVGSYANSSGVEEGVLLTETAGSWATGVEAVLPANANTSGSPATPGAFVRFVSCVSAGNCSAIGTYPDNSGNQEGLLLTETAGSWSAGLEAALPANASSRQFVQWGSLSCASPGNCTAVGQYSAAGHPFEGLMLTETDGGWSTGVEAVPPVPDSSASWLNSVSCASAGNCAAVGAYVDSSGVQQGLLLTETAGSWATGVAAALPADNANQGAEFDSVSCASAGNCTAVGLYDVSDVTVGRDESEIRGKGLLLTETAGSWATGVEAALPANADGSNAVDETYRPTVSCPSSGNCGAAASYYDNSSGVQGVLLTETAGSWKNGVEALPANAPSGASPGFRNSVSCASPGNCGALVDGESLLTETAGSWATGVEPPLPANGTGGLLYSVSCDSAGDCSAVGQYGDTSGHQGGLLIGGSPASVTLDISKNGTGSGSVVSSGGRAGIDCGATCSATFDAGTSLTLAATPSPGSAFTGWSGGGCTGTGTCRVNTGISEQTITATFRLLPKCVVPKLNGKPLKAAEHAIRTHNCTVGKVKHAASRTIRKGHVISQRPKPGRRQKHGAKVSLVVSKGRR
jgi:hypothetical protein